MSAFLAVLAIILTILAGFLMVKGYKPVIVLLGTGFVLLAVSLIVNPSVYLLEKDITSGSRWFDILGLIEKIAGSQLTGVGLIIMAAGGFSAYMNKIGAARALVEVASGVVSRIRRPYLLLIIAYFLGQLLMMVIPSAAGLAILLLVVLLPILKNAGVNPAAAGAVIATSSALPMGPATGTTVLAADIVEMSPAVYFVQNQLIVAVPTIIAIAITHVFTQKYFDKRSKATTVDKMDEKDEGLKAPKWYSILVVLPIILLVIFSPIINDSIELSTVSAFVLVWAIASVIEAIRGRGGKQIVNGSTEFFQGMGKMFGSVVALIIAAQFFAEGLKTTGLIDLLINSAEKTGYGVTLMIVIFALTVGLVTFLTGSGVGAFSAFAKLAPQIATGLNSSATQLVTPMQFASGLFRSMSPVSGVVIAVAGGLGVSPLEIVKRTAVPMIVGSIVMTVLSMTLI